MEEINKTQTYRPICYTNCDHFLSLPEITTLSIRDKCSSSVTVVVVVVVVIVIVVVVIVVVATTYK